MDNFVSAKLVEWKLSALKEMFEENFIDEEAFMLLDVATVKELIKPVGPRMKFLANLRKLRDDQPSVPTTPEQSTKEPTASSDTGSPGPSGGTGSLSSLSAESSPPPMKKFKSDFNVRELLVEYGGVGKDIISEIEEGELTRKNRMALVRIVVAYIIKNYGDRPKCEVKTRMAKAIIAEFPSLKDDEGHGFEAWYTPGKGRHSSTGWIEERLRNARRKFSKKTNATEKPVQTLITARLPDCDLSSEEFESMTEWLKHNVEPVSQVSSFMKKTAVKRAEWIRNNPGQPFDNILREYPRLFDTPGMVEIDFRELYPEITDKLYMLWTTNYAAEVIKYASLQGKWQSYLRIDAPATIPDDKKTNVSLAVLPCILPAGRKAKKRASIDESLASFIDIKPIGTNMPKYLEEVTNGQPFVLILGSLMEPSQCFVIVERKALIQGSLLKAVDVCFKVFYILDISYPWQCSTTWEFFQKVVFGLDDAGGNSKTSPAVIAMRTTLKKVCSVEH